MTFHVGQKVVCVDASPSRYSSLLVRTPLQKGTIYTVRGIDRWDGVTSYYLEEIVHPVLDIWLDREPTEPTWHGRRFRPIAERKTDISIFTSMLNPSKRSVDA